MQNLGNRVTFAAIKGQPVSLFVAPAAGANAETDWPETLEPFLYETYLRSLRR